MDVFSFMYLYIRPGSTSKNALLKTRLGRNIQQGAAVCCSKRAIVASRKDWGRGNLAKWSRGR